MRPARDKDERRCKQISRFGLISTAIVLGLVGRGQTKVGREIEVPSARSPQLSNVLSAEP